MIEVKGIVKRYGDHTAVDGLSFKIEPGKIYGFLGPNGAGKSTTMNIITGNLAATEGTVTVNGHDIYDDPIEAKKCIGYLPEIPPLYNDMTPLEYLTFVAEARGVVYEKIPKRVKEVIEITQINEVKRRLIRNLSKGFRQRVGIAMAMVGNPDIIILDEPTVGLDPIQIIEIRQLIKKLGQTKTVILSSHILAEIEEICDHIMIISHGKLVANDTLVNLEETVNSFDTLRLTVRADNKDVIDILNRVDCVLEISLEDCRDENACKLNLKIRKGEDPRETIFFALAEAKLPILELELEKITLESIFLSLTNSDLEGSFDTDENLSDSGEADIGQNDETDIKADKNKDDKNKKDDDGDEYKPLFS